MSRQKKYMRRAKKSKHGFIKDYKPLSREMMASSALKKILKDRVLLYVSCDGVLCSVYFNFMTGRFSRPIDLPVPEKNIAQ